MQCDSHQHANHAHGPQCGHEAIRHGDHVDFLCDGHLHHTHGDHCDEHRLEVGRANPAGCTPSHWCGDHEAGHEHDAHCGHPQVPHGDHVDYLVGGHLHHPHSDHCDDHGPVALG